MIRAMIFLKVCYNRFHLYIHSRGYPFSLNAIGETPWFSHLIAQISQSFFLPRWNSLKRKIFSFTKQPDLNNLIRLIQALPDKLTGKFILSLNSMLIAVSKKSNR
jgi:hypothetical protein